MADPQGAECAKAGNRHPSEAGGAGEQDVPAGGTQPLVERPWRRSCAEPISATHCHCLVLSGACPLAGCPCCRFKCKAAQAGRLAIRNLRPDDSSRCDDGFKLIRPKCSFLGQRQRPGDAMRSHESVNARGSVLHRAKGRLLLECLARLGIVEELKTDDMKHGLVMTKVDTAQAVTSARAPRASTEIAPS